MPRVSVILTSYNAEPWLSLALASVDQQTFEDWELIVMDDDSSDLLTLQTLGALEEQNDPRIVIKWFTTPEWARRRNCRYAWLINFAVKLHATGEYLTYLCGDDYFLPDRLERMVATLDEGHDVVYGAQRLIDETGNDMGTRRCDGVLTDAFERVDLNSVMHTRASFDKAGGWDDSTKIWRNADAHMWRRLTDAGYVFVPVPGGPTDVKRYRADSVDARVIAGLTPWV